MTTTNQTATCADCGGEVTRIDHLWLAGVCRICQEKRHARRVLADELVVMGAVIEAARAVRDMHRTWWYGDGTFYQWNETVVKLSAKLDALDATPTRATTSGTSEGG